MGQFDGILIETALLINERMNNTALHFVNDISIHWSQWPDWIKLLSRYSGSDRINFLLFCIFNKFI